MMGQFSDWSGYIMAAILGVILLNGLALFVRITERRLRGRR